MEPLNYQWLENPYGMVDHKFDLLRTLLNYGKGDTMDQKELAENLGLTSVQLGLLRSATVDNLFAYARQIYDFEDEELPHDKEDINAVLELFNYRIEFDKDRIMYHFTHNEAQQ